MQGHSLSSRKSPKASLICPRECRFKMSYGLHPNVCLFFNLILKNMTKLSLTLSLTLSSAPCCCRAITHPSLFQRIKIRLTGFQPLLSFILRQPHLHLAVAPFSFHYGKIKWHRCENIGSFLSVNEATLVVATARTFRKLQKQCLNIAHSKV